MKAKEIITEGIYDVAGQLVDAANEHFRKITGLDAEPYDVSRGGKVWTRGDGTRYKDPAKIHIPSYELKWLRKNRSKQMDKAFPDDEKLIDVVWDMITSQGKKIGQVSGEFGSSPWNDAYLLGGVVFVRRGSFSVSFTSPKIFKNMDIWKKK